MILRLFGRHPRRDMVAGVTVGVLLVPQGMAYALLADMPPIHGLYASVLPLIVYALFGTSRLLSVGPVAIASLLTASGIASVEWMDGENYVSVAMTLACMVGVIQLILGVLRFGFVANFLSIPIVLGYMNAAALIIAVSQLKHLFAIDVQRSNFFVNVLHTIGEIGAANATSVAMGLGALTLLLVIKRYLKAVPGSLVVVVLAIGITKFWALDDFGLLLVGEIPSGLPEFILPLYDMTSILKLLPSALTIAVVSFMESSTISKSLQSRNAQYDVSPNQELRALGMANIVSGLSQAFPVSGSFSRSAINSDSKAFSVRCSLVSALIVLLVLFFLTSAFYYLPIAALAAIIITSVFGLVDVERIKALWRTNKEEFFLMCLTFLTTLILGVQLGILAGIVISMSVLFYHVAKPHYAILGRLSDTDSFRNIDRFPDAQELSNTLIIRFDEQLFFANAGFFREKIETHVAERSGLEHIVLDFGSINRIDSTAAYMLRELAHWARNRNLTISFVSVKGPVRDIFSKENLFEEMGEDNFYLNFRYYLADERQKDSLKHVLQSNA